MKKSKIFLLFCKIFFKSLIEKRKSSAHFSQYHPEQRTTKAVQNRALIKGSLAKVRLR